MRSLLLVLSVFAACLDVACSSDNGGGTGGSAGTSGSGGVAGTSGSGGTSGSSGADAGGQDFSCIGSVVLPTTTPGNVSFEAKLVEVLSAAPLVGATVQICGSDADCAAPSGTSTSDASGMVTLQLPLGVNGYTGYTRFKHANILDSLLLPVPPFIPDTSRTYGYDFVTLALLPTLAQGFGLTADPAKGQLILDVTDCAGFPAQGVTVSLDVAAGATGYTANNLPSTSATSTDVLGRAFAFNVETGTAHVTVKVAATQQTLGTTAVELRANVVTRLYLGPTP